MTDDNKNLGRLYVNQMWATAQRAFDGPSFPKFAGLYGQLRRYWQVLRGSSKSWSSQRLFDKLNACNPTFLHHSKLSTISEEDTLPIWGVLQSIKALKE
jgi:hypothetical protein